MQCSGTECWQWGRLCVSWGREHMETLYLVLSFLVNIKVFFKSQFSHSVVFDSLWPRGLQHAMLPCPSPTPRAYSSSCHPNISSSVIPFSSCHQYFPASGSFPKSQFFTSGDQVLELQHQSFQWISRITSWEIDGETVETVSDFIFWGSKITADGDCNHVMTNLDSIFKSKDITLSTKVHLVKAMVFPLVMYGCESWTECWRKLSAEELMLLNCGVGEDSWEPLELQGDPTSPS